MYAAMKQDELTEIVDFLKPERYTDIVQNI